MTHKNSAELRRIIDAATPGEWTVTHGDSVERITATGNCIAQTTLTPYYERCGEEDKRNATHIATFDPVFTGLLCDLWEAAKGYADAWDQPDTYTDTEVDRRMNALRKVLARLKGEADD